MSKATYIAITTPRTFPLARASACSNGFQSVFHARQKWDRRYPGGVHCPLNTNRICNCASWLPRKYVRGALAEKSCGAPKAQRWAVGADAYQVWQRGFDRLFDLQPYKAFTGHFALYYDSPWYNLHFAARVGQYLAQDRGITLEVSRRFSTGVEVGVFATKTNVSSAQFGEGSFDKGTYHTYPVGYGAAHHYSERAERNNSRPSNVTARSAC